MSDLTVAIQSVLPEVKVDSEGKVSITMYGLSQLLGVSKENFYGDRAAKKLVESLAAVGFQLGDRLNQTPIPDVAITCIIEYYALDAQVKSVKAKQLYRAFAAVGIRTYFQQATGWEAPKVNPTMSQIEQMKQAHLAMGQLIAVYDYANNKPGLANMVNYAVTADNNSLPGLMTVEDVLARKDREFSAEERCAIGMYAATAYRNLTGKKPEQVKLNYKSKNGKSQVRYVAGYPIDFMPVIENAIELGFGS